MDYNLGPEPQTDRAAPHAAAYAAEELDSEFKRKYPPDPYGKEMEDNARVWRVYRDEATLYDKSMLDGWNKTLDILLIFAGLFSAVVTAFVIESYQLLQPDPEEYIAAALYAALVLNASNASISAFRAPSDFTASVPSRWINGLWFTSLIIALSVALSSILVKQWLEEYSARMSTATQSTHHWARRRALYFQGMMDWHVPEFISSLPVALHLALFLFFAGLVVLLWTLDLAVALWILLCTVLLFLFYVAATVLPMHSRNCPTSTPILHHIKTALLIVGVRVCGLLLSLCYLDSSVRDRFRRVRAYAITMLQGLSLDAAGVFVFYIFRRIPGSIMARALGLLRIVRQLSSARQRLEKTLIEVRNYLTAQRSSRIDATTGEADDSGMDLAIIRWLLNSSPSREVNEAGLQAMSAVNPTTPLALLIRAAHDVRSRVHEMLERTYRSSDNPRTSQSAEVSRDIRALLCVHGFPRRQNYVLVTDEMFALRLYQAANASNAYDLPLLAVTIETAWTFDPVGMSRRTGLPPPNAQSLSLPFPAFIVLRILHSDLDLPFSYHLLLLAFMAYSGLTKDECRGIADVLRARAVKQAAAHRPNPSFESDDRPITEIIRANARNPPETYRAPDFSCTRDGSVHPDGLCTANCFLELVAKVIQSKDALRLRVEDVRMAIGILMSFTDGVFRKQLPGDFEEMGDWYWLNSSEILQMPTFMEFMASDEFFVAEWTYESLDVLQQLVAGRATPLRPRARELTILGRALINLIRAAIRAKAPAREDSAHVQEMTGVALTKLLMAAEDDPLLYDDFLFLTEACILHPANGDSLWAMVSGVERYYSETYYFVKPLAGCLARALCVKKKRGLDVSELVDEFFSTGNFIGLLWTTARQAKALWYNATVSFADMVYHCNLLRPTWWQDFCAMLASSPDVSKDLKRFASTKLQYLILP